LNKAGPREPGTLIEPDCGIVGCDDLQVDPRHLLIGSGPFDCGVQEALSEARASPFAVHAHSQQAPMLHAGDRMRPQVGMADDSLFARKSDPGPTPSWIGRSHIQGSAEASCFLACKVAVDSGNGLKQRLTFGPVVGNVIVQVFGECREVACLKIDDAGRHSEPPEIAGTKRERSSQKHEQADDLGHEEERLASLDAAPFALEYSLSRRP
jgi:hypothetical protein